MRHARLIALLLLCGLLLTLAPQARAQTLTTLIVATTTDSASVMGSLRYQLNQANAASSTPTQIIFDSSLDGMTITPTSRLELNGNIRLLAQDSGGMPVDITLDGSSGGNTLLWIDYHTVTVSGFTIRNFPGHGIRAFPSSLSCPANARVTITDNVLVAQSLSNYPIRVNARAGCAAVTISDNDISADSSSGIFFDSINTSQTITADFIISGNTISAGASGIYLSPWNSSPTGMATTSMTTLMSDNAITAGEYGIRIATRIAGGSNEQTVTLSGNRITGAQNGIHIVSTPSTHSSSRGQITATLSRNYVTGANFGLTTRLLSDLATNVITLSGTDNVIVGSSILDIYASEYGASGDQAGRSGYDVNGSLENTVFNTQNIRPDSNAVGRDERLTLTRYQAAEAMSPPADWVSYLWPDSFTARRYQASTLPTGATSTPDAEYGSSLPQDRANALSFSIVSAATTPIDPPIYLNLLFRNAEGNAVTLGSGTAVRVCLPLPAALSDASGLRIAWLDRAAGMEGELVWRALPSYRSDNQICANIFGYPTFTLSNPNPPGNTGGGGSGGGGGSAAPPPAQPTVPVGVLENPQPASFQSGIGLFSGWTCATGQIELEVEGPGTSYRLQAASGTGRADVAAAGRCEGRGDVGFGLLFNWNLLGDGVHTVRALADGVEFDRATFTVTTLGEEFIRGASGETLVADFPSPGEQARLVWQQSLQNFMLAPLSPTAPPPAASFTPGGPLGILENPAGSSFQSGIGLLSGWVCSGEVIELEIDGMHRLQAASGTGRGDVANAGVCEGRGDVGFGLLFNWNMLDDGVHTVRALADGVEFDRASFRVTTLDEEFIRDASGRAVVADFPSPGEAVTLVWQQSSQNFAITTLESSSGE